MCSELDKKVRRFLEENYDEVIEIIELAKNWCADPTESSHGYKISVVITEDFEIEYFMHPDAYMYTVEVLHVIAVFQCDSYELFYEEVAAFLSEEQKEKYNRLLYSRAEEILCEYDYKEFLEMCEDEDVTYEETLQMVIGECDGSMRLFGYLRELDKEISEEFLENLKNNIDIECQFDEAVGQIFY